jgi:hypothetical protein
MKKFGKIDVGKLLRGIDGRASALPLENCGTLSGSPTLRG